MTDFARELEANVIEAVTHFELALLDATSRSVRARINKRNGKRHDTFTIAKELNRINAIGVFRCTGSTERENLKTYKPVAAFEPWRVSA